ncbi:MAG: hypothetical protein ABIQ38_06995 [Ilumatobacteraceae bacterium]
MKTTSAVITTAVLSAAIAEPRLRCRCSNFWRSLLSCVFLPG